MQVELIEHAHRAKGNLQQLHLQYAEQ